MDIGSPQTRDAASPRLIGVAWVLFVLQVVVAGYYAVGTFLGQFSLDSCADRYCDYAAFRQAQDAFYIGALALLIGAGVGIALLMRHPRVAVWIPVLGSVLTVFLFAETTSWAMGVLGL